MRPFFAALCGFLKLKHLEPTAYHPQTSGQVKRYNKTMVSRSRRYVAEHQIKWDIYVQPRTYTFNTQFHGSSAVAPFSLVLSRHRQGATTSDFPTAIPSSVSGDVSPQILRSCLLARPSLMRGTVEKRLTAAQKRNKYDYDKCLRKTQVFKTNELVLVDRTPLAVGTNNLKATDKTDI